MEALRLKAHVDSDTLQISGLEALANRDVEVIILVEPEAQDAPSPPQETRQPRRPGWAKGKIWISDDFHKPLDEEEAEEFYK
ncbi:MAG: type II toxin-antitoxin system prevent-host-death family antitoxin [Planctomycetes bacterium]|nr:type II toxin-antitoxin system prevent-host-death family antitoxin [Planctomycetota bacterium]